MADQLLDATGLKCPMPVLRARRALKAMESGAVLEVLADDPAAAKDFPAFCEMTGNSLEDTAQDGPTLIFRIRKA
ncbi:MAG TPA: sulfurtransferase TusA family protein [Alphaproteobacteria bacterium]|nr:sulfurtransferase TusA family protein [Alphaproteobacteria bacterium]